MAGPPSPPRELSIGANPPALRSFLVHRSPKGVGGSEGGSALKSLRFCLSEKDGGEYIQVKYKLEALQIMRGELEQRKKNKVIYDAVANIKKLTVQSLQKLLTPILNRNSYVKLNFSQPRIEKQVIIDFTVQDAKSDREEYDSEKQLEKIINKSLCDVNWKLMSNGISYWLGILSGSLKGFETEEDLVKLVKSRQKKIK